MCSGRLLCVIFNRVLFWNTEQQGRTQLECHVWHTLINHSTLDPISLTGLQTLGVFREREKERSKWRVRESDRENEKEGEGK